MSNERDGAGSAGTSTDTGTVTDSVTDSTGDARSQTAVVTRPARPTGKRSRRDAEAEVNGEATEAITDGKVIKNGSATAIKTAKKAADRPSRNPFAFIWNYLKQVVAELRKVIWPNRKQMANYTAVVLVFLAFMVALIGLVDFGLTKLVMLVFG